MQNCSLHDNSSSSSSCFRTSFSWKRPNCSEPYDCKECENRQNTTKTSKKDKKEAKSLKIRECCSFDDIEQSPGCSNWKNNSPSKVKCEDICFDIKKEPSPKDKTKKKEQKPSTPKNECLKIIKVKNECGELKTLAKIIKKEKPSCENNKDVSKPLKGHRQDCPRHSNNMKKDLKFINEILNDEICTGECGEAKNAPDKNKIDECICPNDEDDTSNQLKDNELYCPRHSKNINSSFEFIQKFIQGEICTGDCDKLDNPGASIGIDECLCENGEKDSKKPVSCECGEDNPKQLKTNIQECSKDCKSTAEGFNLYDIINLVKSYTGIGGEATNAPKNTCPDFCDNTAPNITCPEICDQIESNIVKENYECCPDVCENIALNIAKENNECCPDNCEKYDDEKIITCEKQKLKKNDKSAKKDSRDVVECACPKEDSKDQTGKQRSSLDDVLRFPCFAEDRNIEEDSGGVCSLPDSTGCTCEAAARAQYYQNKLESTLQILKNKEDTIRVQVESLAVAEGRIANLTERVNEMKRGLDMKTRELQCLKKTLDSYKVEKADVCISVEKQEVGNQNDIVTTLQDNLSVIEELYRECFYETAKQESLIDMLRNSYLDVRLMEKQKSEQIVRMQSVIDEQKWSVERCQELALEVDNLKMEMSNLLTSSPSSTNNDSGMWERSEECCSTPPGMQEELQQIMTKLLTLRDLLVTSGCVCGLEDENKKLKQDNKRLESKVSEFSEKLNEVQGVLAEKIHKEKKQEEAMRQKEKEMQCIRRQVETLQKSTRDQTTMCDSLSAQLNQVLGKLDAKTCELHCLRQQYEAQERTVQELRREVEKTGEVIKQHGQLKCEMSQLSCQVSACREQLADSESRARDAEHELERAREHCEQVDQLFRSQVCASRRLQARLAAAQARGAALCGGARAVVGDVLHWARRLKEHQQELERLLKEKDDRIQNLQLRIQENETRNVCEAANEPTCSKYLSSQPDCTKCLASKQRPDCSKCVASKQRAMRERAACSMSASETGSRSPAPMPPKRILRKKVTPVPCFGRLASFTCDASVQQPLRAETKTQTCSCEQNRGSSGANRVMRDISPSEELFLRMEQLSAALEDGQRRWFAHQDR